ncbi:hypothetical protein [uncultured Draconibacterium sp.]|uniref:hypothetical protein n=1 Tax=uncultured Draconibacterium sp. TaxID=1573823 RepID=UPI0025E4A774|nr:hypothetical protein [uncultured Draconibacterium sp.]
MKRKLLYIGILILFLGCQNNTKNNFSISGRWWYVENGYYKEIHANDTCMFVFDFSNVENKYYSINYFIEADTLWTFRGSIKKSFKPVAPFMKGEIFSSNENSFKLVKNKNEITYHKLDNDMKLFNNQLSKIYTNGSLDSLSWRTWLSYQESYENRAIQYFRNQQKQ